jgi:hypothetical protein
MQPVPLDLNKLLSAAVGTAELEHICDRQCQDSLKALVDSCNKEAALSFIGQLAVRQHLSELLETRSRLFDYWHQVPEILEQPLHPQIFITGLPKSGSTFLHRLLAQDSSNRVPRMWEVMHPLPPPSLGTYHSDLRIRKIDNRLRWLRWTHPALVKAHPVGAIIPQECGAILGYSFESSVFLDMFTIPSYEAWLRNRSMESAYELHSKFLKHLQWQCPAERWVLKSSDHLHALKTLVKVYPEARFVFLHRYPLKVLQAACSQMVLLKSVFSRSIDLYQLGAYETRCLSDKINLITDFHDKCSDFKNHFIDIRYQDLASDPLETVRSIYDRFGLPLFEEAESRMAAFAAAERGKSRSDNLSLADFGLSPKLQSPLFDLYCERFGVESEEL